MVTVAVAAIPMYHHPRHDIDSEEGQAWRDLPTGDGADGKVTCTYLSAAPLSPPRVVLRCLRRVLNGDSQLPWAHLTSSKHDPFPAPKDSPRSQRHCGCHHQLMREGAKRAWTFLLRSAKQATAHCCGLP